MRLNKRLLISGASVLAIIATIGGALAINHSRAAAAGPGGTTLGALTIVGDTTIGGPQSVSGTPTDKQVRPEKDLSPQVPNKNVKNLPPPPTKNPNPAGFSVTAKNPGARGFNGLSHADQRLAGTGAYTNTQFSLEPPDQGLCVARGYVMESVNNALALYKTNGTLVSGPTPNSQFFQLAPETDRVAHIFGPFISDPKCLFDNQTQRWFMTELEQDNGTNTGATGRNFQLVAVSQTSDPTGKWTIFKFDTTDDGLNGTPSHAGCPCFGDQPLIGTDSNGFYITTNEFGAGFDGAQVYAISKVQLAVAAAHSGSIPTVVHIDASTFLSSFGGLSYSLQPAIRSPGEFDEEDGQNQYGLHGVEYFLSALQFGNPGYEVLDNRIAVWGLTNTASLNTKSPNLTLNLKVIGSETYGQPGNMTQKDGAKPLGDSLGEGLEQIQSNDDRMNQVVLSNGYLWGALNTLVGDGTRTGIAYFKVRPSWSHGTLNARMATQGYVAVDGNNVAYPSVAVNGQGQGVIAFTLVGPGYYPSAAYVRVSDDGAKGPVHVSGAGAGPDDGFTGYPEFGGNAGRWGDYSAALVASDGSIWTANEYIGNGPRTVLANWGTFITQVTTSFDD